MRKKIIIAGTVLMLLAACVAYKHKALPFKPPSEYPNATGFLGATVAAKSFDDRAEARDAFGFDVKTAGLTPVMVVIDNRADAAVQIASDQTFLVDEEGNLWPVLTDREAYNRVSSVAKPTEVFKKAGVGAVLGAGAGALIGAAIGIVAGTNVIEAAGKGAALGAAGGATLGGAEGLTSDDVKRKIRNDLRSKNLENLPIPSGNLAHGFIFFPGEAKHAKKLRLQMLYLGERRERVVLELDLGPGEPAKK